MLLGARAATSWVMERARDVELGQLERTLEVLGHRPVPSWDGRRHYSGDRARTTAYILVLDTLNFSFWGAPGGYWRLAEALRDDFKKEGALADPARLAEIEAPDLARIIGDLPMIEERALALRELGAVAISQLEGDLGRLVEDGAALTAAGLSRRLVSFHDVALYDGGEVPFLKRAQIAAADLAGSGVAGFPDLDALTCFADYKLPQTLRHLGALVYSDSLARRVDDWLELQPGEPAEVEIRAATVVCVERLVEALAERGRRLRAFELDWMLWALSQELYPVRPHHRVRTIYY